MLRPYTQFSLALQPIGLTTVGISVRGSSPEFRHLTRNVHVNIAKREVCSMAVVLRCAVEHFLFYFVVVVVILEKHMPDLYALCDISMPA